MSASANRRILIIDDTPSIHGDFRRILGGSGGDPELDSVEQTLFGASCAPTAAFDLDSAYQGEEGWAKVCASLEANLPYALAFIDMRIPPGWDGLETIRQIWQVDPRLQIVICTAYSDYSWDEVLGKLGADDRLLILKKPFDRIEVSQLANALTTKWELTQQATLKVSRLEEAVRQRTAALEIANQELGTLVREANHVAHHDALTGLPNRLLFADRASQSFGIGSGDTSGPVLLMLDLDRFKEVNDTLGHAQGDLLLRQVAQRISAELRPGDTVARFGGDEFVLLLPDGGYEAGAAVATRIAKTLEVPFTLGSASVSIEASVGIAAAASAADQPTLEEMLRRADIAMHKAKVDRSGYARYGACRDERTPGRLALIGDLRQALDCDELVLYYQPKVRIGDGELFGVEALVRWRHPTRGLLVPADFIELAEETTLIHRLTAIVIDKALRSCRSWLDRGVRLPVAVNLSARSLFEPGLSEYIAEGLANAGLPADVLTVELTEGTVMAYPDIALRILHVLHDMGVRISVDDYGTGYSSMAYLKNLPIDELKIDRTFVKDLTTDPSDAAIVRSATHLGHDLGLCVLAEGIEDEETLAALNVLGVDLAQGYHIGRPMPETLLQQWIADHTNRTAARGVPLVRGLG